MLPMAGAVVARHQHPKPLCFGRRFLGPLPPNPPAPAGLPAPAAVKPPNEAPTPGDNAANGRKARHDANQRPNAPHRRPRRAVCGNVCMLISSRWRSTVASRGGHQPYSTPAARALMDQRHRSRFQDIVSREDRRHTWCYPIVAMTYSMLLCLHQISAAFRFRRTSLESTRLGSFTSTITFLPSSYSTRKSGTYRR